MDNLVCICSNCINEKKELLLKNKDYAHRTLKPSANKYTNTHNKHKYKHHKQLHRGELNLVQYGTNKGSFCMYAKTINE